MNVCREKFGRYIIYSARGGRYESFNKASPRLLGRICILNLVMMIKIMILKLMIMMMKKMIE